MRSMTKPILITMGDAAGIGPEIIAKGCQNHPADTADCVVVGDVATMRRAAALVKSSLALPVAELESLARFEPIPHCIQVLQKCELLAPVSIGLVNGLAGKAAADCIVWAACSVLNGQARAMVTAPVNKEALAAAGGWVAQFPGHTEMLQFEAAKFLGKSVQNLPVRMMLANDELKTVLVSIHMSLRQAIKAVTLDSVLQTLRITHAAFGKSPGTNSNFVPHIGVAGLNPHAGEGGLFGTEEQNFIAPAIAAARLEGMHVSGPFAPDTVFMRARHTSSKPGEFDVVVAMYHDQGLIPVKYLGVEQGVNVTLGLPLIRTSPDHGTAFDIAGTGKADESSLLAAIRMARKMAD